MVKALPLNTLAALGFATSKGLVLRDFLWVVATKRDTGEKVGLGAWNGRVPVTAAVARPSDGVSIDRDYQAMGTLLQIPPIPAGIGLEVRTIRIKLSHLSDPAIKLIREYDAKMATVEIHRGIFDPDTNSLVDPAICRFSGFINRAPIRQPKAGGEGSIELECVSNARMLTRTSARLFSDETLKERSGDRFGRYLDVAGAWRIFWGQDEVQLGGKTKPKERFRSK